MREQAPLTEAMFYILLILSRQEVCGTEIAAAVEEKTDGRVRLGPGTLYTILGRFQEQGLIEETAVEGRKRTYRITGAGLAAYRAELLRLRQCIQDAEEAET